MDLRTYRFIERTTYIALAKSLGVSPMYLVRVANGLVRSGPELAIRIEKVTNNKVPRSELRPDLWPPESESFNLKKSIDK